MKKITGTLINPAISVMNRLRFGQKIALIGVLFCLPIAALFHTLVTKIETDLAFTRAEITGLQSVTLIGHLAQNLQKHRGLSQKIIGGETAAESKLAETAANIDQLFGQLDNFDKLYGATYKTQSTWQDIKSRWAKLRSAGHSVGASQSFNDHSELVSRLAAYLTGIADGSNLSLDPDLDTYYLMDAVVFRLPNLAESVAKMRGLGAGVAARDAATPDERIAFAVLGKLAELDFGNLQGSLEKVFAFNPDSKSRLSAKAKLARDTIGEFTSAVESKIIKAEKIAFDGDKYFKQGNDAVDSAFALFDAAATDLGRLLAARVTKMESDRTQTLLSLGAVLAAVLYLYVGFLLSVKRSLATIVTGVGRLAKGDLTSKIDLHTRDELREVADSVDKVASTLNLFASAQIEMADQHQAGKISHKLPADNFAGAFKEIADKTNDLVGSQIAVTMRVVEVVSSYSKGDLSTDMDRLPGEKARITGVVDDVKASLLAINSQIGTLVDAAASGDFKVRGDTGKYQHEFRKMISRLNELMEVSDTGLAEVSRVLAALAKGDLTETISNQYSGTFGQLKDDSNITVARLTEIIGQLRHAAESINTAAKEIASGNADLSSRTEEQASSLEETASSMEELASAVRQNAENARAANQLAISANEIAVSGGETVGKAIAAMVSISESSKRIENIINVIDGIAF
ncbi:MAG: HAMP domain-containing protein, partial [Betaproteobacteria bacterium]|nr:HAMP domain-containing protein [Betaproteobacteria bacterium]